MCSEVQSAKVTKKSKANLGLLTLHLVHDDMLLTQSD